MISYKIFYGCNGLLNHLILASRCIWSETYVCLHLFVAVMQPAPQHNIYTLLWACLIVSHAINCIICAFTMETASNSRIFPIQ